MVSSPVHPLPIPRPALVRALLLLAVCVAGVCGPAAYAQSVSSPDRDAAGARDPLLVPDLCWAPGSEPALVRSRASRSFFERLVSSLEPRDERSPSRFQFADGDRWTATATDGCCSLQGDPITLTWSIVPDGTSIFGYGGEPTSDSDLRSFLDSIYGSSATWLPLFQQVFNRWSELTGVTYVYEPNDDGSAWTSAEIADGQLGVRGDIRIAGHLIDGNANVLAYNFFPNFGDMVIDTADDTYLNTGSSSLVLRNILAHEHGHGLGLSHVCPVTQTKLMEPFLSTGFDGPQHDDRLAAQRGYGDRYEHSDTTAQAAALGSVGSSFSLQDVSIDDDSDTDVYSFDISVGSEVEMTVTPIGSTYLSGHQNSAPEGDCSPGVSYNSLDNQDLAIEIIDSDGATTLAAGNATGAGLAESLSEVLLASAGTYYARITGPGNQAQLYRLDLGVDAAPTIVVELAGPGSGMVTSSPPGIDCPGDCVEVFSQSPATLTATPNPGSQFSGWSGDADCADGVVDTSTARTCTATFDLIDQNLLTVSVSGNGSVASDPAGISCGADCSEEYDEGTEVTLTPSAGPGASFQGFSGNSDCLDGIVTMNGPRSCTATFVTQPTSAILTVQKQGSGTGTVTSVPVGINCGMTCQKVYPFGTIVRLLASPTGASVFVGWSGSPDCLDGLVTLDQNHTCVATFALETRNLSVVLYPSNGGTVGSSPSGLSCPTGCNHDYELGSQVQLIPKAAAGKVFSHYGGNVDCSDGVVTVNSNMACAVVFLTPPLFEDGFESGDTTNWSVSSP